MSPHRGRRVLSGAGPPPSTFGHFRGPLWRFCEAVFTLDPPESRIPGRGWADATNSPQIGELQVTGVRRPGRPCRRPPAGAAGQALDENVGAARGGKRARDVGVSVGVRPRGPSVQLRGSIPLPSTQLDKIKNLRIEVRDSILTTAAIPLISNTERDTNDGAGYPASRFARESLGSQLYRFFRPLRNPCRPVGPNC